MKLAVLVTCHNRREKTLRCLESLFAQRDAGHVDLSVWLVDDRSTDGTPDAVATQFPGVRVIAGDGSLFWCAGMRLAWIHAAASAPDAYLWLNDDVVLESDAIELLHVLSLIHPGEIVIGSCACPSTGLRTYGGLRRVGEHPGKLEAVTPGEQPMTCDTFEGNIVWVPATVFSQLGLLGPFQHSMGDIDYGYRAAKAGIGRRVAPGFLGRCSANSKRGTWEDRTLPAAVRYRQLTGTKGLPAPDWWRFCRRHGGFRAPLYFVGPLLRIACRR